MSSGVTGADGVEAAERALREMISDDQYPCLGARSVFNRGGATLRVYQQLGGAESARSLLADLTAFAEQLDPNAGFASFLAVFQETGPLAETEFERLLWQQLRAIRDLDRRPWDASVSADPANPHFAFSVAGTAYFVVGMHPGASRPARRTPMPVLVFNPHQQFDRLRETGRFTRMREIIRRRDRRANGSVNPMMADHGEQSEACQYSGRQVDDSWKAPLEVPDQ